MFENSKINLAVNSVYKTLENRLTEQYKLSEEKAKITTNDLLKIHGMSRDDFSIIQQFEDLLEQKLNDKSIDDNSNKGEKTIRGMVRESEVPLDKILGYRFLYRKMVELYGKKEAKNLSALMYDFTLALSDSSSIMIPYCWAFDASKLVSIGKPFGQLPSKQAKRLESYTSLLNEVIHQMSNHVCGAIAVGTFFLDAAHLLLLNENVTIENLKEPIYRKKIENQFQKIVHGFNSLSRNGGVESPFTNISLFDREKLKKLVGEEYNWYFYNEEQIEKKFTDEYIIEFIVELQNIFMEFFDKGDPMNDGMPYRFPVVTLNVSRKKNKEGNWMIEDKQFLKSICKKDIYRYNIFVSEGNKVSSCCRLINNVEMLELASQANSFGAGGSISLGSHRVVCINFARLALISKTKEEYHSLIKQSVSNCKKILKAHKQLLKDMKDFQVFLKLGWIQLNRMFSTIGIIGYVEAEEILKNKLVYVKSEDVIKDSLFILNNEVTSNNENYPDNVFNVEQIPAESMSHRLPRADKLIFGNKEIPFDIYSNQFVPLWDNKITVWDKMKKDGNYISMLTGGGISHVNVGEHITSKQTEKLIEYAIESNLEHFALNGVFCKCENGHVLIGNRDTCAKCGAKILSKITRVVGFFTPVEDWSLYKRKYDFEKRKEFSNGDFDIVTNN
jgi:ribonucleoside-triphosphate reductase (formate)